MTEEFLFTYAPFAHHLHQSWRILSPLRPITMSVCLAGIRFIFGAEFGSERVSNSAVRSGKGERDRAMAMDGSMAA